MNTRMIGFLLGRILMVEAGLLALPLLTALLYGEPLMPWLATMLVLAAIGGALSLRKPERTALYAKDGFAAVALVGGGAAYYFKVYRPKHEAAGLDEDDYDYDEADPYGDMETEEETEDEE